MKWERFGIVGAGLSGILLAKRLNNSFVVEKSRGIGGRIASRRLGGFSIDHGNPSLEEFFPQETIPSPHAWLKAQTSGLEIIREFELEQIKIGYKRLFLKSKSGHELDCEKLFISAPAPQSKKLLKSAGLEAIFLDQVTYASEVQFMALGKKSMEYSQCLPFFHVKQTEQKDDEHSLILLQVRPEYQSLFLEMDKEDVRQFALKKINGEIIDSHAHKWRYSKVLTTVAHDYQLQFQDSNIYLVGDYFGEGNIQGSLNSINRISI